MVSHTGEGNEPSDKSAVKNVLKQWRTQEFFSGDFNFVRGGGGGGGWFHHVL
jgi:hypothetical protein